MARHPVRETRAPRQRRRGSTGRPSWRASLLWLGAGLAFIAVAAVLILLARSGSSNVGEEGAMSGQAPEFVLPRLDGEPVALSAYRGERNVLLFFNEGYGCPPCWQQARELQEAQAAFDAADTELLVVIVDPPDRARQEVQRWGLTVPVLLDESREVSRAYRALGFGMHADKPNHTFVFVDAAGEIRWWKDYASMYAPTEEVIDRVEALSRQAQRER